MGSVVGAEGMADFTDKASKQFFFEKKNQKTFARYTQPPGQICRTYAGGNRQKFFGSFFQKRTASFLPYKYGIVNRAAASRNVANVERRSRSADVKARPRFCSTKSARAAASDAS